MNGFCWNQKKPKSDMANPVCKFPIEDSLHWAIPAPGSLMGMEPTHGRTPWTWIVSSSPLSAWWMTSGSTCWVIDASDSEALRRSASGSTCRCIRTRCSSPASGAIMPASSPPSGRSTVHLRPAGGHATTRTHDYICQGTLSLMAALDLDTGKVYYACAPVPHVTGTRSSWSSCAS